MTRFVRAAIETSCEVACGMTSIVPDEIVFHDAIIKGETLEDGLPTGG